MIAATYDVVDGVAVITLNRPEAMNAVNAELALAVGEGLERADGDPAVGAVVITGNGRAFCAGMDLKAYAAGESVSAPGHDDWGFAGIVRHPVGVPIVAAVNGFAMGGGTEIVLAADLAVAGRSVRLGLPEVKRGLVAAAGGVLRLPRMIPRKIASELVLTGDPVTAERAAELGLLNAVVQDDQVLEEAISLARRIAVNAPLAVRASKRIITESHQYADDMDPDAWQWQDDLIEPVFASEDAIEGARAFAQKRAPKWAGR